MNLKKNVFSYLMWFIYSVAVCMALWQTLTVFGMGGGYSKSETIGFCVVWLLVCGWAVFFRKQHIENARDSFAKPKKKLPAIVVEVFFAVVLFAIGIFLRVQKLPDIVTENTYFELAKVAEGQTIPSFVHGAIYLYLNLLHTVFVFFGNKIIAGVWLQIGLLILAGVFLYFAVRRVAGAVPALTTLAFLAVGPFMVKESLTLSPQIFFLAVCAIAFFVCTFAFNGKKSPVICFLSGVLVGAVCYLDVMGITLICFLLCGILLHTDEENPALPIRMVGSVVALLGGVVGFVLLIAADAVLSFNGFFDILLVWWKLYQPTAYSTPLFFSATSISFEQVVFLLLLPIGMMGFWIHRETEKISIWTLSVIALFLLSCFGMTTNEMNGSMQFYVLFFILSGVSFSDIVSLGEETKNVNVKTKRRKKTKNEPETSATETTVEETSAVETPVAEPPVEEIPAMQKPQVTLLENPLPLPKPHVKKNMDYDIVDIHPTKNCYDIRVADDDDFDVK